VKLYKIKPLKWIKWGGKKEVAWWWWTAVTPAKTYKIVKVSNKYQLRINESCYGFPLFDTLERAEQTAEGDYIEMIEESLELVEDELVGCRRTAVIKSAEEITGIYGAVTFSVSTKNNDITTYTFEMNSLAGLRIEIIEIQEGVYCYKGMRFRWLKNWLKDFRKE